MEALVVSITAQAGVEGLIEWVPSLVCNQRSDSIFAGYIAENLRVVGAISSEAPQVTDVFLTRLLRVQPKVTKLLSKGLQELVAAAPRPFDEMVEHVDIET